jgi:hypothetical protein
MNLEKKKLAEKRKKLIRKKVLEILPEKLRAGTVYEL